MKKVIFSFYFGLLMILASLDMACYARVNHVGVGMEVAPHDQRWHYDHDYDDEWRSHHAWHDDRRDWDR